MNDRFDHHDTDPLINGVLADENWSAFDSQLRANALKTFVAARRRRRVCKTIANVAALILLAAFTAWFVIPGKAPSPTVAAAPAQSPSVPAPAPRSVITEQQMLSMFPPGSCVVAEINGEKQLVFLDPKIARDGFAVAGNE